MKTLRTIFALFFFAVGIQLAQAQSEHYYTNENMVVLDGYDVVNYFTNYEAAMGSKSHATTHNGVVYYFTSAEHKAMFTANPEKYMPAYGGFCAWGVSEKKSKFPVDPKTFKIHNGNLYFFFNSHYDGEPMNTMIPWNGDEAKMISKADKNWKSM